MRSKLLLIYSILVACAAQDSSLTCSYKTGTDSYYCLLDIKNPDGKDDFAAIGGKHELLKGDSEVDTVYGFEGTAGSAVNIPSIICGKFVNLKNLWMDELSISVVNAEGLSGCKQLESLYLGSNDILELPVGLFDENDKLKLLDLANNKISALPGGLFSKLGTLESLYLDRNPLMITDDQLFSQLTSLRNLWLSSCGISDLKQTWFDKMVALEVLWLDDNNIADLQPDVFESLANLRVLKLSANKLTSISVKAFPSKMANLKKILVNGNQVKAVDVQLFETFKALDVVEFQANECIDDKFEEFSKKRDENLKKFENCFKNFVGDETTTKVPDETTSPGAGATIWREFLRIIPVMGGGIFVVLKFL